ncbi:hypothetical protein PPERSA_11794 [Pseudocohnilembus persalinus]|uniref:Uncharacterized protein n=1 Tax=Pseudocohnilembus persalinus TaxID=266149 RepID=A0A0V0QR08_PSEPJ|nr:hypothetical protein PPERSA_11794 [Pseudocohnilembus persalinus]|eukprot:KRX04738.1 hypothetical protein PPERSA_11794 [Pseudocohnilembus persalinus]
MSVTPQQIEQNAEAIQAQLANEKIVNWEEVNGSQQSLTRGFQAQMEKLMMLRDSLQRNYLNNLKELKGMDASDLLKQIKEKKQETGCLKNLVDYGILDGEKVTLDVPALKEDAKKKQDQFINVNKQVTDKLFETCQWIENFVKTNINKQGESQQQSTSSQNNEVQTQEESKEVQEGEKNYNFYFDEDKLNQICSKIQVQRIPNTNNLISIKTYSEIVEQSVYLAEQEFVRLTFDNRKDRREQMKDSKAYLKLMMDHLNEVENMLMKSQEDICKKLGISQEKLEQSEVTLMERGLGQQLFMMQASVRSKIKEKLPKNKTVNSKLTKEVIEYQIKLLNDKQDQFIPVLKELPQSYESQQIIPVLLNLMISDLVYEEYSLEEEDYMHNLTDQKQFKEQQVLELLQGIEQGIINLLQNSGLIPKGGMGMPGGMPPGGMPPMGGMGGMGGMPGLM